ncbi:MarR family transcriptional regulator [Leptolyngbya cf. ectocarpi LEGE 11479]|uniref:MarR family transcriptional regulator n=1 Tax=Leptolyngbya cf. ectocarpi LEGE 11479 TaxID=1828722 RepID=A0A929F9Y5_LEPEC|nr:MarR family transcriptional regulator [Leptolyngbya ectocarpi]MBE9068107.1 MarR family transcriptional regulator [Leptolyngbya cf. ectocarpi LEGE 11479]
MTQDNIDKILVQWQHEAPTLDVSSLAVVGRVLRIAQVLEKHREAVLADFGLTVWSFDMLATLRRQGPPYQLKPTALYKHLMLSSGAMTNRIDRLEKDGMVTRLRDPDDRRSVIVQLSEAGVERIDAAMPVLFARERQFLAHLSQTETADLILLLRQFLAAVHQQVS